MAEVEPKSEEDTLNGGIMEFTAALQELGSVKKGQASKGGYPAVVRSLALHGFVTSHGLALCCWQEAVSQLCVVGNDMRPMSDWQSRELEQSDGCLCIHFDGACAGCKVPARCGVSSTSPWQPVMSSPQVAKTKPSFGLVTGLSCWQR